MSLYNFSWQCGWKYPIYRVLFSFKRNTSYGIMNHSFFFYILLRPNVFLSFSLTEKQEKLRKRTLKEAVQLFRCVLDDESYKLYCVFAHRFFFGGLLLRSSFDQLLINVFRVFFTKTLPFSYENMP